MWNTGQDKRQAGIKIAGRNINNLRYADDTTLMAENKEELKSFLICIQISQEASQVVWYSHCFKNFPQFVVIHKYTNVQSSQKWHHHNPVLPESNGFFVCFVLFLFNHKASCWEKPVLLKCHTVLFFSEGKCIKTLKWSTRSFHQNNNMNFTSQSFYYV